MKTQTLLKSFKTAGDKLLLLDYDGTLVNFTPQPKAAKPDRRLLNLLTKLSQRSDLDVVILTGRASKDIDTIIGHLPIQILAEHGAMVKKDGVWSQHIEEDGKWKNKIFPVLIEYALRCPGAFVEEKPFALSWHYREAKEKVARKVVADMLEEVSWYQSKYNLKVLNGKKVFDIMPNLVDKGCAALLLLHQKKYASVLSIGDDKTDEAVFKALLPLENCLTIKVGQESSLAKHCVSNPDEVLSLLESL